MASCSDDDDDNTALRLDSNSNITLDVGETQSVTILGGKKDYIVSIESKQRKDNATTSTSEIISAQLTGNIILVTAKSKGSAILTVKDANGDKVSVTVTVTDKYAEEKADSTPRFKWNEISKVAGVDTGVHGIKTEDNGLTTYTWVTDDANSITLTYMDKAPRKSSPAYAGVLTIKAKGETKTYNVITVRVIKSAVVEGEKTTKWVVFQSEGKEGICVDK